MLLIGLLSFCLRPLLSEQEKRVEKTNEYAVKNVGTTHQVVGGNADPTQITATTNKTT